MVEQVLDFLVHFVTTVIDAVGYSGIVLLMAAESANIPIPSEAIMPFAGFLVARGDLNILWVAIAGTLGNWLGSSLSWWVGARYGKGFVHKFGKYVWLNEHHLDQSEAWFRKYGDISVFVGRLLPIVRTFISLPAGFAKMNYVKFSIYTILGAFPFCYLLTWLGYKLGERWEDLRQYFHYLDFVVAGGILLIIVWLIWRKKR